MLRYELSSLFFLDYGLYLPKLQHYCNIIAAFGCIYDGVA